MQVGRKVYYIDELHFPDKELLARIEQAAQQPQTEGTASASKEE